MRLSGSDYSVSVTRLGSLLIEERSVGLILVEDNLVISIMNRVCGEKKPLVRRSRVKGCSGPAPSQDVSMLSVSDGK